MSRVLLFLACLISPWFYGFMDYEGQSVAFTDLMFPVCVFACLKQKRHEMSGLGFALFCFCVAALLSVVEPVGEGKPTATLLKVIRLWGIISPAMLLSGAECTHEDWVRYLKAFFVGGLVSLTLGVVGFFFQWEPIVATQAYIYDGGAYLHRSGGVFRDSGAYGHLLATWVGCTVLLLMPELSRWWRAVVLWCTVVIGALGLYTSVSRSAALNIGAVLSLIVILKPAKAPARFPQLVAGAIVLVLAVSALVIDTDSGRAVVAVTGTVTERIVDSFESLLGGLEDIERTSGGRLTTWRTSLEAWSARPLLGVGYKMLGLNGNPPDNTFILALCETGALGFGALAFFFGLILWRSVDRYSREESDGRSFLILWTGQLIHGLNADILTFFGSATSLLILTLIWYRLSSREPVRPVQRDSGGLVAAPHSAHYSAR